MQVDTSTTSASASAAAWIGALAIAAFAVALYANTLTNQFVVDDLPAIVRNEAVHRVDLGVIFATPSWWSRASTDHGYRPLPTLTFALNYAFGGNDPRGYHAVNIALHALVSVTMFLLLMRLGARPWSALGAALLFAAHPLNTEAVASITGRAELGAALFTLLAVYADAGTYGACPSRRRLSALVIVATCFALGLLCKESAAALLPIIAATDWLIRCDGQPRKWLAGIRGARGTVYMALLMVLGSYGCWRWYVQGGFGLIMTAAMNPLRSLPVSVRIWNAAVIAARYLWLLVMPVHLSADYMVGALPVIGSCWDWRVAASILAIAAVVTLAHVGAHREMLIAWGVLFAACAYGLVSNVVFPVQSMMAERWMYLPGVGFCTALALGTTATLGLIAPGRQARWATLLTALLLSAYTMRTLRRNRDWRDAVSLWSATVRVVPGSFKAHEGLGYGYYLERRYAEAVTELAQAVQIYAEPRTLQLLGSAYAEAGQPEQAVQAYEQALLSEPFNVEALRGLGVVELRSGNVDRAIEHLERAAQAAPSGAQVRADLGAAYYSGGRYEDAKTQFVRAVELAPSLADGHTGVAACAFLDGDAGRAAREYLRALALGYPPAALEEALIAALQADPTRGSLLEEALRYFPDDTQLRRLAGK